MADKKELSDYVTNCMSIEKTRDFLEMQGENFNDFKPVLLGVTEYDSEGNPFEIALEKIAEIAINRGCKYVTNIQEFGHNPTSSKGPCGGIFWFSPAGTWYAGMVLAGTGLIPD